MISHAFTCILHHSFSCALRQLREITPSFYWITGLSLPLRLASVYFGFGSAILHYNPLYRVDVTYLGLARESKRLRKESRRCPLASSGFNCLLVLSSKQILTHQSSLFFDLYQFELFTLLILSSLTFLQYTS